MQQNRVGDIANIWGWPGLTGNVLDTIPCTITWIKDSVEKFTIRYLDIPKATVCYPACIMHFDISKATVQVSP